MEHQKQVELLQRCLELTAREEQYVTDDEFLVPVDKYVDRERFDAEVARFFKRSANVAAHSSELPEPGDFVTRTVVDTPVIIVRQKDGRASAFINVCRHRGATVELRERGRCRRFVCPYHAWAYETDGTLAVVRQPHGFPTLDRAKHGLVRLPCFESAGLVWVCPEPGAVPGAPDVPTRAILDELHGLGATDSVVFASTPHIWHANWKLLVDGGLESYHFRIAHRKTIAEFFPDNTSTYEFVGSHVRTVLPRRSILDLANQSKDEWRIRDHTHLVYQLAPNGIVLMQKGYFDLLITTPLAPDRTRVDLMAIVPHPGPDGFTAKSREFWEANHQFTKKTLDEDFTLAEQIQRGIASGANDRFRFAGFEGALTRWHQQLDSKLTAAYG